MDGLDGIVRIPLPTPFQIGTVNAYLIEDDPLTLVDTGLDWPDSLDALEQAARRVRSQDRGHCDTPGRD